MSQLRTLSEEQILHQTELILLTPAFKNSPVLKNFLEYIVKEALHGRENEIKEYSIGVNVLNRNQDFNPQFDATVRIHAGRLRRALKEYYHEAGKEDGLIIEIPKGRYVPVFELRTSAGQQSDSGKEKIKIPYHKPIIAVLPFRNISHDPSRNFFADGLGEQLSTDLARFQDLSVIAYFSSSQVAKKTTELKEFGTLLGAQYVLAGSIHDVGEILCVNVQLIQAENSEQLWVHSFERKNTAPDLFEIQHEIIQHVLTAIAGYYGVISRHVARASPSKRIEDRDIYDVIFWYYHYNKDFTPEILLKTIKAMTRAIQADPEFALAWAILGQLYITGCALGMNVVPNAVMEGWNNARKAISIDPLCQNGYVTLAWASLFLHKREECINAIDQCIALNPNEVSIMGTVGYALICAGEFERGNKYMKDSVYLNPYFPSWFNMGFSLYAFFHRQFEQALYWAEKIDKPEIIWDPLLKTASLGHLNRLEEAKENASLISNYLSLIKVSVRNFVSLFLLSDELIATLLDGLQKAGLEII